MSKAFVSAVRLLARREHGAYELSQKLVQKKHPEEEVHEAIAECQRLGLQSDERFVDNLCRARIRQGYGPLRIRQDLQAARLDRDLVDARMAQEHDHWSSYAHGVLEKKYKHSTDRTPMDIQKQKQFLLYRGFSMDIINFVFKAEKHHE